MPRAAFASAAAAAPSTSTSQQRARQRPRPLAAHPSSPPTSDWDGSDDGREQQHHLADFFTFPPTPELTPPSSLPTSPPTSPDSRFAPSTFSPLFPSSSPTTAKAKKVRKGPEKARGKGVDRIEIASGEREDDDAYRVHSPILPKVTLSFPTILSDDDDDDSWLQWPSPLLRDSPTFRQQSFSHATTTTRRSERRTWRYSMPSLGDDLDQDIPHSTARPSTPSSSTTSTPKRRSHYTPPRHFDVDADTPPPPLPRRRTPSSTTPKSAPRSRTSSLPTDSTSTRFFGRFSSYPSRRVTPKNTRTTATVGSVGVGASSAFRPVLPSFAGPLNVASARALPVVKPVVNLFVFITVAILASFFLVAGFTLTFWDDSIRKIDGVRRGIGEGSRRVADSIEGVRHGMGRMLSGAQGALDLVVRNSIKRVHLGEHQQQHAAAPPPRPAASSSHPSSSTSRDDPVRREEADDHFDLRPPSQGSKHRTPSFSRGRSRTRRRPSASPGFARTKSNSSKPSAAEVFAEDADVDPDEGAGAWTSEDDIFEYYAVPNPSPERPAPGSPSSSSSSSSGSGTRRGRLPPRPPLVYLLPSILFALTFTFFKVVHSWWVARKVRREEAEERRA
ncbi:hypothetical protein MNV49_006593 [Pseudohyphozyma bogoriensis]|nr:hypothetical protein MNV49_006593 [Pseudohyphozyma bogoriensis]